MKQIFLTYCFILIISASLAQPKLEFLKHGIQAGDTYRLRIGSFVEPGLSGVNRLWDFSEVQLSENWLSDSIYSTSNALTMFDRNDGYCEMLNSSNSKVETLGYNDNAIQVLFDNPVTRYNFPFSYGNMFNTDFTGKSTVNNMVFTTKGNIRATADAYGDIVLPGGRGLTNLLRIKTTQTRITNYCFKDTIVEEKYDWYAANYRYPVFTIVKKYTRIGNTSFDTTKYCLLSFDIARNFTDSFTTNQMSIARRYACSVSPNPSTSYFLINYRLPEKTKVRIGVFTVGGSLVACPINGIAQDQGVYSYTFQPQAAGVYWVCFCFNEEKYTTKVIKTN